MQNCIWPSWCHCHSLSLASVKSRLVLPFWYWLTWVVPEKGPLNGCVCVCVIHHSEHEVYAGLCVQHPWTVFTLVVVIKWKEPKTQQNGKVYAHCHADDCPISIHAPTDWISQQHVFLDVVYAVLSLDACLMCSAVQCYAVDCWKQSTLLEKCCVNMH